MTTTLERTQSTAQNAASLIGRAYCFEHLVLPVSLDEGLLVARHARPTPDIERDLQRHTRTKIRLEEEEPETIVAGLRSLWGDVGRNAPQGSDVDLFLRETFLRAMNLHASDVIQEPKEDCAYAGVVIEGITMRERTLSLDFHERCVANIAAQAFGRFAPGSAQRGRMSLEIDGRTLNMRLSSYPVWTPQGTRTKLAFRLLPRWELLRHFGDLGLTGLQQELVRTALHDAKAGILTIGPPAVGKSTTAYALLRELDLDHTQVYSIEDPPEIYVPGITQTAVNPETNWTYDAAVFETVRQNAQFVFVGESLDPKSTTAALNATLTAIPSITSLHAADAAEAIPRLLSLGIPRRQIAQGITCLVAQRLLPLVCKHCSIEEAPTLATRARLGALSLSVPSRVRRRSPDGCPECNGTGLRASRVGIFEVIPVDSVIRAAIIKEEDPTAIAQAMYHQQNPMVHRGAELLAQGEIDERSFSMIPVPLNVRAESEVAA